MQSDRHNALARAAIPRATRTDSVGLCAPYTQGVWVRESERVMYIYLHIYTRRAMSFSVCFFIISRTGSLLVGNYMIIITLMFTCCVRSPAPHSANTTRPQHTWWLTSLWSTTPAVTFCLPTKPPSNAFIIFLIGCTDDSDWCLIVLQLYQKDLSEF